MVQICNCPTAFSFDEEVFLYLGNSVCSVHKSCSPRALLRFQMWPSPSQFKRTVTETKSRVVLRLVILILIHSCPILATFDYKSPQASAGRDKNPLPCPRLELPHVIESSSETFSAPSRYIGWIISHSKAHALDACRMLGIDVFYIAPMANRFVLC